MRVFVSYSNIDKQFVSSLESSLKDKYIDYFLDEKDILYGDSISKSIHNAFDTVTHLIVVISPASEKSHWVSFEIGMALGRNIKVIPILTHLSMNLPPFIQDIKYFKSIDEFNKYFYIKSLNTLMIETVIDLVHYQDLGIKDEKLKGQIGIRKFNDREDLETQNQDWEPAFIIKIRNLTGRTIELKSPMVEFNTPQKGIFGNSYADAVGFMPYTSKELVAGGLMEYIHPGSICIGTLDALINDNIKSIVIESVDGFKHTIDPTDMSDLKKYAETFFIQKIKSIP